jgi:hypothetical protein
MTRHLAHSTRRRGPVIRPRADTRPPVVSLDDARRRRGEALLRHEQIPDQEQERRAWNDRPRGDAA